MAVSTWHYGKIVLLWAWGIALTVLSLTALESTSHFVPGFLLIAVIVVMPVGLSAITWRWLSGRERRGD